MILIVATILNSCQSIVSCNVENFGKIRFDTSSSYEDTLTPTITEHQPCGNNGFVEKGICKTCPHGTVYDKKNQLCFKKPIPLKKAVNKVCPRDTVPVGDMCRPPCPRDLVPSEATNTCIYKNDRGVKPYLSPLHCPYNTPYLNPNTMKCEKNIPLMFDLYNIPVGNSTQPCSAASSIIL